MIGVLIFGFVFLRRKDMELVRKEEEENEMKAEQYELEKLDNKSD